MRATSLSSTRAAVFSSARIGSSSRVRRNARSMNVIRAFFGGGGNNAAAQKSAHEFSVKSIDGGMINMKDFSGKVVVAVNVASA